MHEVTIATPAGEITLETGRIGRQADGAVLLRHRENVLLATAVAAGEARPGAGFFPLTVEYRERLSAAGRIPGSYQRREGRITDHEVLASRLADRSVRPLFPDEFLAETQVLLTVLSADEEAEPEALAIVGAAAALHVSGIPWLGPLAGVRIARTQGALHVFPTRAQRAAADLDLVVSAGPGGLVMVEGQAAEASEAALLEAIARAGEVCRALAEGLDRLRAAGGREKRALTRAAHDPALRARVAAAGSARVAAALAVTGKAERRAALEEARVDIASEVAAQFAAESVAAEGIAAAAAASVAAGSADPLAAAAASADPRAAAASVAAGSADPRAAAAAINAGADAARRSRGDGSGSGDGQPERIAAEVEELVRRTLRERTLDGVRADGRGHADIRPIWGEVGWLPRCHGSAIFTRGETQALVSCTLGSARDEQKIETLAGEERERFLLHYNFPPYSVGEVRALRGPGRREIGHGNLAHRALGAVLPPAEAFPYTVRLVSDISESNGSSSMATVCGGCLALMDAGVPIARPVAGIAMGLIAEDGRIAVLSDILGDEDHLGDMDFKVTGTREGVTAIQMDNKVGALPDEVLAAALEQARAGRLHILDRMAEVLPGPRERLSPRAPRIVALRIRPERIRDLIGAGGRTIQELQAATGTAVDVENDGLVRVYGSDAAATAAALRRIRHLTLEPEVGKVYDGEVIVVTDFLAIVRLGASSEGKLHVSELDRGRVGRVQELLKVGDAVRVRVLGVDHQGKIALSRRAALDADDADVVA